MEYIFGLMGGGQLAAAPEVTFKVDGVMPVTRAPLTNLSDAAFQVVRTMYSAAS